MNDSYDKLLAMVTPRETDVPGLKHFPDLEPHCPNDRDAPLWGWISWVTNSECNIGVVHQVLSEMGDGMRACMEIGVNRDQPSMSKVLIDQRPPGSFYLGIDLKDKSYLDSAEANTWTLRVNSHDQNTIRGFLKDRGIEQLDLLFIDGDHSVDSTVNDWRYTDLLSDHGVVIMHDTNTHPGCVAVFDAVDPDIYDKTRYCTTDDFGIAVFRKKKHV